ncbi:hypothetical protein K6025_05210 [Ehrlichia sp. JZT12]
MMNFTRVLNKLIESCAGGRTRNNIHLSAGDDIITADTIGMSYFIRGGDAWTIFANALRNLSNLILQNCTKYDSNSASANTSSTTLRLDSDDSGGVDTNTFAIGFVSGVVAASLVVTSYFLLKKCLTGVRSRGGGKII